MNALRFSVPAATMRAPVLALLLALALLTRGLIPVWTEQAPAAGLKTAKVAPLVVRDGPDPAQEVGIPSDSIECADLGPIPTASLALPPSSRVTVMARTILTAAQRPQPNAGPCRSRGPPDLL